jgi:trimeric autotransporter adhesin
MKSKVEKIMMRHAERQHGTSSRREPVAHLLFTVLFCCFSVVTGSAYAQIVLPGVGIINTLAGDGTVGYSGDGGAATSAELDLPYGLAVDTAGNIYIADTYNNRIRKVTATTGDISTVAGDGIAGYSGDGGTATSAELDLPCGVAVDTAGNIYIADTYNSVIRKVTASTGIIYSVAGDLSYPDGVAVDSASNIYIADSGNNRVRELTATTGIVSTVAGDGVAGYSGDGGAATSAELNDPRGVAVNTAGNIYIADTDNNRIRKVTVSTDIISTVVGDGTAGFSGNGGAATSAELNEPWGVAVNTAGAIYIADFANNRIRKVTASTGIISTLAGDGTAGYSGDGGAATKAELNEPAGVALDKAGNIYIADTDNDRIRAVGK